KHKSPVTPVARSDSTLACRPSRSTSYRLSNGVTSGTMMPLWGMPNVHASNHVHGLYTRSVQRVCARVNETTSPPTALGPARHPQSLSASWSTQTGLHPPALRALLRANRSKASSKLRERESSAASQSVPLKPCEAWPGDNFPHGLRLVALAHVQPTFIPDVHGPCSVDEPF